MLPELVVPHAGLFAVGERGDSGLDSFAVHRGIEPHERDVLSRRESQVRRNVRKYSAGVSDSLSFLARAAACGDEMALREFVRSARAPLVRFCASLTSDDEAEDLAQETLLRMLRALPVYRGDSNALTWLLGIARHVCADHVRRTSRRRRIAAQWAPPTVLEQPSSAHELEELLDELDVDQRAAFVLTRVIGLTYDEAASVCGCPMGTVRSRVARARARIAEMIALADAV
jgi:RNA polymerase sigma-70 factor (ECF subfamily)